MLNDLFINTLILISFTFVGGHLLKEVPHRLTKSVYIKGILGIGGGLLGILMMLYTIGIGSMTTLLDLRVLSIMMVSFAGGTISTIIACLIIALFRVVHFGINQSSIFAMIHVVIYIISFYFIDKKVNNSLKNWFVKLLIAAIILDSTFFYLIRSIENYHLIILSFSIVFIVIGTLEYYLLNYVRHTNELYRHYKKDSTKDFLTGLNNTREFDKLLNMSFKRVQEGNEKLSCLMIDIDHFKKVNDTYGHTVGDIVLKELSYILKKTCRSFDIIGRIGGEEFCILLPDCPKDHSFEVAMRIINVVRGHKFTIGENKYINITVSVGLATFPDTVSNVEEIKEKADNALYKAKHSGRDRVCDYEDS
jgi:diguanylate cyclase